ncbi:hypothetical protein DOTSEDRAFT_32846 [Dothistroma septosporum NZE10]|uniref:Uncharacterized protein n=1 Tax=Dothistroma septosporum (strain NZE10 / CBS 128990) TaxID=675120 RepID=N1PV09_DOTSN|nr:hypothetical protein DOTSEDRAFT_32846 [Dothistroma septosporum NZE10]
MSSDPNEDTRKDNATMSAPRNTLLRFSRFTTSLSEVPILSRRAQLRGFSASIPSNSQTRSSTDNPQTGATAAHDSIPPASDSGPGVRDAGVNGSGSPTGIPGNASGSASSTRDGSVNSNASSTPSGEQIRSGSYGASDGSIGNAGGLRESPNKNVNEAHNIPSEGKKDTKQATKRGQQDADPDLRGQDEGPQSINAEKEAAKK